MIPYLVPRIAYALVDHPPPVNALASIGTLHGEPVIVILGGPSWKDASNMFGNLLEQFIASVVIPHEEIHQVILHLIGHQASKALDRKWPWSVPT